MHGKGSAAGIQNAAIKSVTTITAEGWFSRREDSVEDFGFGPRWLNVKTQRPRRSQRKHSIRICSGQIKFTGKKIGIDISFDLFRLLQIFVTIVRLFQHG